MTQGRPLIVQQEKNLRSAASDYIDRIVERLADMSLSVQIRPILILQLIFFRLKQLSCHQDQSRYLSSYTPL
jgi:hypothetical protein